jgi:hypothetical protein
MPTQQKPRFIVVPVFGRGLETWQRVLDTKTGEYVGRRAFARQTAQIEADKRNASR